MTKFECGFVRGITARYIDAEQITAASSSSEEKGERADARELLREILADGPMDGAAVAKATGVSERTLKRARKDLGVTAEARRNDQGHITGWTWKLPEGHKANTTVPSNSWPSGHSGPDQHLYIDNKSVSLQEDHRAKAGTLDLDGSDE